MGKYFLIEPEVAGGWGQNTLADTKSHPPLVHKLHYEISGWMGDDLLETFPCFIVTQRLQDDLLGHSLTGFTFDEVEITKSGEFFDLNANLALPQFVWLKVVGRAGIDDFGLANDHRLVVSDAAYQVLRSNHLDNATVEPYRDTP